MKKIVVLAAVAMAALFSQAAALDWKYGATKDDVGKTIYVLVGETAQTTWESVDAVSAAATDSGVVKKSGTKYTATGSAESSSYSKDGTSVYYVIVSADGSTYDVTSVANMTGSVYDPGAQESSPGQNTSLSSASITSSGNSFGGGGDVPEPTSGLLLLVGGAMLALRRKQK